MSNLVGTSVKTEIIKRLFTAFETGPSNPIKAADDYITFLTEDSQFKLGNQDARLGHKDIRESIVFFCQQVKGIYHDIKQVWQPEENVVILEMEVTYYRLDDTVVTFSVIDLFRFKGNLIKEIKIFMDINPLFA